MRPAHRFLPHRPVRRASHRLGAGVRDRLRRFGFRRRAGLPQRRGHPGDAARHDGQRGGRGGGAALRRVSSARHGRPGLGRGGRPGRHAGALALYLGFRHAAFSVAGPISAVGAAGFSVLAGLLLGERPTALALIGIVLALPAIVGVSASAASADSEPPEEETDGRGTAGRRRGQPASAARGRPASAGARPRRSPGRAAGSPATGVAAGLVAGAGFALLFIGLDRAGSGSGLWPVAATPGRRARGGPRRGRGHAQRPAARHSRRAAAGRAGWR